jgi:uncharacterized protein YjbI with pentapeptide repeats
MADEEQIKILNKGVDAWNTWREENPGITPNLTGANLVGRALIGVDFGGADLSGVNCRLSSLCGANLSQANLTRADLSRADLTNADLSGANLSMADMTRSIMTEAQLGRTTFGSTTMGYVEGLDSVRHSGPSVIGVDTVYFSQGQIPDLFLRRAGVPENFITYIRTSVTKGITYCAADREFAERLYDDLQGENVRCWLSEGNPDGGETPVEMSTRIQDKLLLVLSENSINADWARDEVGAALRKEQEQREKHGAHIGILYVLSIDEAMAESSAPWAAAVERDRHVVDFRDWRAATVYRLAFRSLLTHLQTDKGASD